VAVEGGEDRRGQAEVEGEGDHETVPAPLPLEAELEAVVRHRAKESRERRESRAQKRSLLPYGMLRPKPDAPSRDGSGPEELDREGERARGKEERWKEERLRQMGRDLLDEVAEGSRYTPLRVIACRYVSRIVAFRYLQEEEEEEEDRKTRRIISYVDMCAGIVLFR